MFMRIGKMRIRRMRIDRIKAWRPGIWAICLIILLLGLGGCESKPEKYTVSGQVVDGDGKGLAGVSIAFSGDFGKAETDSEGNWSAELLGTVTVTPAKEGWIFTPADCQVNGAKNDVNFTGTVQTYTAEGYVKDADGKGIPDIQITFSGDYSSVTTDTNGYWKKVNLTNKVTATPVADGWEFNPANVELSVSNNFVEFIGTCHIVTFTDPLLEQAIRTLLGKTNGVLTREDVLGITSLNINFKGISSLEGIEELTNLQELNAAANKFSDLQPLANLTSLQKLILNDNNFTELAPLSNLTQLQHLSLSANDITDISPLVTLTNLHRLEMNLTLVSNISVVVGMKQLEALQIYAGKVVDLSPVAELTNLTELIIPENLITDITPLTDLTNLVTLNLSVDKVKSLQPLSKMTKLEVLYLDQSDVTDLSALQNLTAIKKLSLYRNYITDIKPLVQNIGLGEGDYLELRDNYLDLGDAADVKALKDRGVEVMYDPQRTI